MESRTLFSRMLSSEPQVVKNIQLNANFCSYHYWIWKIWKFPIISISYKVLKTPSRHSVWQVAILATATLGVKLQYQDRHLLFFGHTISGPGTFTSQSLRLSGSGHEAHTSLFVPHKQHLSHICETKAKRISQPLGNHVCRITKLLRLRRLLVLSAGGKTQLVHESGYIKKWKGTKKERKEEIQIKTGEEIQIVGIEVLTMVIIMSSVFWDT